MVCRLKHCVERHPNPNFPIWDLLCNWFKNVDSGSLISMTQAIIITCFPLNCDRYRYQILAVCDKNNKIIQMKWFLIKCNTNFMRVTAHPDLRLSYTVF